MSPLRLLAFLAEVSREDLGAALSLWDGEHDFASLQDALHERYPSNMVRELVRAVEGVRKDFNRLSPDLHHVEDVQEVMSRFLAVYPEVTPSAQRKLAHSFCMENR